MTTTKNAKPKTGMTKVTMYFSDDIIAAADDVAAKLGATRSYAIRLMTTLGIDTFNKHGVTKNGLK